MALSAKKFLSRQLAALLAIVIVWYAVSILTITTIVPAPHVVAMTLWEDLASGVMLPNAGLTLFRTVVGLLLAFAVGAGIGFPMGLRKYWEDYFGAINVLAMAIPSAVWAFVGIIWYGPTSTVPIFASCMVVFPYVAMNIWQGVKAVDSELLRMGEAFGIARKRILRGIFLPSIMPFLFSAIRYGFALSWQIVVIAEAFSTPDGIGEEIYFYYGSFNLRQVLAWGIFFVIIVLLIEGLVLGPAERKLFAWRSEVSI